MGERRVFSVGATEQVRQYGCCYANHGHEHISHRAKVYGGRKGDAMIRKSDLVCSLGGTWAGGLGRADDRAEKQYITSVFQVPQALPSS